MPVSCADAVASATVPGTWLPGLLPSRVGKLPEDAADRLVDRRPRIAQRFFRNPAFRHALPHGCAAGDVDQVDAQRARLGADCLDATRVARPRDRTETGGGRRADVEPVRYLQEEVDPQLRRTDVVRVTELGE